MTAVEYLSDLRKAPGDDALAALLANAAAPFDRPDWWERLARLGGLAPRLVFVRSEAGGAVLPLQITGGHARALANWYTFRWRPLVTPGCDPVPLYEMVARDLARSCWAVTLDQLPEEDGTATQLTAAFRRAGWMARCVSHDSNHVLHVNGRSYAAYRAGLPGPLRTTLKRKEGRVQCRIHHEFSDDIWDIYQQIYADSWKPAEGSPEFLRDFAQAEAAAGRMRLGLALIAGEPVAAQLWTVEGGTAFIHKLAHRESARAHSPGSVLSAALFEEVIDHDRVNTVDFGTGDDAYKRDWMEDVRPRYRLEALRASAPRAWLTWGRWVASLARRRLGANLRLARTLARPPQRG